MKIFNWALTLVLALIIGLVPAVLTVVVPEPIPVYADSPLFYSTTYDGYVFGFHDVYSTVHNAAYANDLNYIATGFPVGNGRYGAIRRVDRGALFFDTSSLGADYEIYGATITMYVEGHWCFINGGSTPLTVYIHIVDGTDLEMPIVLADYGDLLDETTSFGSICSDDFTNYSYVTFTLNALGIAEINKTGITQFALRSSQDINNDPTGTYPLQSGTIQFRTRESSSDFWPVLSIAGPTLSPPSNLTVIPDSSTSIAVSWTKGEGSTHTMLRYSTDAYPETYEDGDEAYFDIGSSVVVKNLEPGTTYYFRAWGWAGGLYSDLYVQGWGTTLGGGAGGEGWAFGGWFAEWMLSPSIDNLTDMPFYQISIDAAGSIGMSGTVFFIILGLLFCTIMGIAALSFTHNILVVLFVVGAIMVLIHLSGVFPFWIVFLFLIISGSFLFLQHRV